MCKENVENVLLWQNILIYCLLFYFYSVLATRGLGHGKKIHSRHFKKANCGINNNIIIFNPHWISLFFFVLFCLLPNIFSKQNYLMMNGHKVLLIFGWTELISINLIHITKYLHILNTIEEIVKYQGITIYFVCCCCCT